MKKFKIFKALIVLFSTISISYSSFVVVNNDNKLDIHDNNTNKLKVEYKYNNQILKTEYVGKGSDLSLRNAPKYIDGSNYIEWKSENLILGKDDIKVNSNLTFVGSSEVPTNLTDVSNLTSLGYSGNLEKKVSDNDNKKVLNNSGSGNGFSVSDWTIKLDTNNKEEAKIQLENDVILNGNLSIGGITGSQSWGSNSKNFGQVHAQGYIVTNYATLDLKGHDLILTNNSVLDSYGLITDSIGGGKIILTDNSSLKTPFAILDMYHEDSMPEAYFNNTPLFNLYFMPYLQANIVLKNQSSLIGHLRISLGGSGQVVSDINLISTNLDNTLIKTKLNQEDSYIERNFSVDSSLQENFIGNYLLNQKVTYKAFNAKIYFENWNIKFNLSGEMNFTSKKYLFYIPPFYSFYLYKSSFNLNQLLVFMNNTYLFVDKYSKINLGISDILTMPSMNVKIGLINNHLIDEKKYQSVGGLMFLNRAYNHTQILKYCNIWDINKSNNAENRMYLESQSDKYWNSIDKREAFCDFEGELFFVNSNNNNFNHNYRLSGNINFKNIKVLKNLVNQSHLDLFSSTALSGPNRTLDSNVANIIFGNGKNRRLNISEFNALPLISNGKVIIKTKDSNNQDAFDNREMTFDSITGVISSKDGKQYAFIYDNEDIDNIYKANDLNKADSLSGSFIEGTYNNNTHEFNSINGKSYIYFQGAFIPKQEDGTYSLLKFRGEGVRDDTNNGANHVNNYSFIFDSNSKTWKMK